MDNISIVKKDVKHVALLVKHAELPHNVLHAHKQDTQPLLQDHVLLYVVTELLLLDKPVILVM